MFNRHELEWTPEKVSNIWAFINERSVQTSKPIYFSHKYGGGIIKDVKKHITLQGKVLDFGCGNGHMIEKLLSRKITCQGADFSEESIDRLIKRSGSFANSDLFLGAFHINEIPSPSLKAEEYGVVFLIETIEHLFPAEIDSTLNEISRTLNKGGYIVVTTPNDESLIPHKEICPDCGCVFHRWQHMTSWTTGTMTDAMSKAGFEKIFCGAVLFDMDNRITLSLLRKIYMKLTKQPLPHLLYIGRKFA
jgi:2-polyprenyl-3-methyl-5-hydroxy-6-metoxy-1,4-benzoquinol methylase